MTLNTKTADSSGEDIPDATWGPPDKSNGPAGWPSGRASKKDGLLRGTTKVKGRPIDLKGQAGDGGRR
jgi:hypothetical protein